MRSMTGFGRFIMEEGGLTQQWEIRSVNSKRLELKWQLPSAVRGLESRLEKTVKRFAARGRLDVSLSLQSQQGVLAGGVHTLAGIALMSHHGADVDNRCAAGFFQILHSLHRLSINR